MNDFTRIFKNTNQNLIRMKILYIFCSVLKHQFDITGMNKIIINDTHIYQNISHVPDTRFTSVLSLSTRLEYPWIVDSFSAGQLMVPFLSVVYIPLIQISTIITRVTTTLHIHGVCNII